MNETQADILLATLLALPVVIGLCVPLLLRLIDAFGAKGERRKRKTPSRALEGCSCPDCRAHREARYGFEQRIVPREVSR